MVMMVMTINHHTAQRHPQPILDEEQRHILLDWNIFTCETIVSMGTLGFNKFGVHTMCKYEIRSGTNTISPNLSKWDDRAKCQFSMGKKYDLASKQIQITISPNLSKWESHPLTLRTFLDTLWWTSVKKSCCRQVSMYMGGIISRFLQVLCPRSDSIWPLLFLHPLSGGCRTRLRIRSKSK